MTNDVWECDVSDSIDDGPVWESVLRVYGKIVEIMFGR